MKFTCHKSNLSRGLSAVIRAVATRPTMPVLSNVLLSADDSGLSMTATNLEMTIKLHINAQVDAPGAVTLPARTLVDLVTTLPNDNVTVSLNPKTVTAAVACHQSNTNIKGIDAREFPEINLPESAIITIPDIRKMIDQVEFAASLDEARPVLCGVNLTITGTRLRMAATDGFRISLREAELPEPVAKPISVIIPSRSMAELARLSPEDVSLSLPGNAHAVFYSDDVTMTTLLIEGNFPDFEQIIPKTYTTTVTVSVADLTTAARQAEIIARDSNYGMLLDIKPGDGLTVSAQSDDGSMQTDLHAEVTGKPLRLMLNINYLKDFLTAVKSPSVTLQCNQPNSPVMLRPSDGAFDHVIMPMVLNH